MPKKLATWLLVALFVLGSLFTLSACSKKQVQKDGDESMKSSSSREDADEARRREMERERALRESKLQEEARLREMSQKEMFENQNILFGYNDATLTDDAKDILSKKAQFMKDNAGMRVKIEGHCDERGTVEYNLALGERRAAAAKQYMLSLGASASSMSTISYGKERPLDPAHNEGAWSKNRRAQFVITGR
ncbi:MAG: peptidoglycan-associated lipoprotein Pal [Deltaproteobacteria bacterium]|nr:peptidoglycan-associated lipoprotein Pal [Deltaproteobacteria bacterium]